VFSASNAAHKGHGGVERVEPTAAVRLAGVEALQEFEAAIDMSCQDIASIEAMSVRSPCARRHAGPLSGALRGSRAMASQLGVARVCHFGVRAVTDRRLCREPSLRHVHLGRGGGARDAAAQCAARDRARGGAGTCAGLMEPLTASS
jgi:hypothetical protein